MADIKIETLKNTVRILEKTDILKVFESIKILEKDRIWCGHDFNHAMDAARITYIMFLEKNRGTINEAERERYKDIIYTFALLHDTGREEQYKTGSHHTEESMKKAEIYLEATDYTDDEKKLILSVIREHNSKNDSLKKESPYDLISVFKKADKLSRMCFICPGRSTCYWKEEKKNRIPVY